MNSAMRRNMSWAMLCILSAVYLTLVFVTYGADGQLEIGWFYLQGSALYQSWTSEWLPWLGLSITAILLCYVLSFIASAKFRLTFVLTVSFVTALWLSMQPVYLSVDIFRYLWDARLLLHGVNPFAYVPTDAHVSAFESWRYWPYMAWKTWPTAYPPVAQYEFASLYLLASGNAIHFKVWLLLNHVISLTLFVLVLSRRRFVLSGRGDVNPSSKEKSNSWIARHMAHFTQRDWFSLALFALFPAYLFESFGAGHVDQLALPWLLAAWFFALGENSSPVGVGATLALATAVKIYPVVLLAAFWKRGDNRFNVRLALTFALTLLLVYLPLAGAGKHLFAYLALTSSVPFNAGPEYWLSSWLGLSVVSHFTVVTAAVEMFAWGIVLLSPVRRAPLEFKVCFLGVAFLLFSPVVHPWYLIWLLPYAVVDLNLAVLWWIIVIHGVYNEFRWIRLIEYIPSTVFLVYEASRFWLRRKVFLHDTGGQKPLGEAL